MVHDGHKVHSVTPVPFYVKVECSNEIQLKPMYLSLQNREKVLNTTQLICETSCSSALAVTTDCRGSEGVSLN